MKGNAIYSAIRRTCLRHLFLPLFSVIAIMIIYYFLPFSDVFTPRSVQNAAEAISLYQNGHEYAEIFVPKLYYTGFDISEDEKVKASYYYEITNNRCTFYLISADMVGNRPLELENVKLKVKLESRDGLFENMMSAFATNLGWTNDGMKSVTNNVILNQYGYRSGRYAVAFVMQLAGMVYSMALVTINLLWVIMPATHMSLRKYYASQNTGIKEAIAVLVDDFENNIVQISGDMYLSEKYFYNLGKNEVSIIELSKIIMGYEYGKLGQFLGIHLKVTHTLCFRGYPNQKILATGKNATDLSEITETVKEKYPDILWGHTKENAIIVKHKVKEYRRNEKKAKKDRQK